ncbi:FkbM family methyltransferase [Zunongwangia sp.]|uniref:FkbM family methyltransferase n=1 Tax=Zunongwangia sp. TaxID=1965325 RepID=UPI003AA859DF
MEKKCVWSRSHEFVEFCETNSPSLPTIKEYTFSDSHSKNRNNTIIYRVHTISLNDLLNKYNAPRIIDYLSIDTEGS